MDRRLTLIIALAGGVLAATTAQAQTIQSLFGDGTRQGCFKRVYDSAHFARNPRQRVKEIAFDFGPEKDSAARQSHGPVGFGISLVFRSKSDGDGGAPFYCRNATGKIICDGESDSGTVEVTGAGPDAIKLRILRGLGFENATRRGYVTTEDGPDDKVFILHKAPIKACAILR